ncbi:MBL fold metallo-hydrolase [Bradyrhizobium sp. NAS80.1]|uniref:MBL fold metallo-hydrolase n=1 Tax=Bradyrhizobium sp. NAS80.1 TaxID=1680159 RepID=UPI001AEF8BEC|nr:MBL fold metallo-hydrolase [Bradyrhizobium sp. NAS80.1]
MKLRTRRVGDYEIAFLFDGMFTTGTDSLVHANGPAAQAEMLANCPSATIEFEVNHFALRGPGGLTLVDAGTGPGWSPSLGRSWGSMRQNGIAPADVDRVLLTHLHFDHARGLLDGEKPYFPRAEILIPSIELAFYTSEAARLALPEARRSAFPITAAIVKAYGSRIKPFMPGEVLPGIETLALPGHTMGQTGFLLRGNGETALFWADAAHMADIQTADPDVSTVFDYDPKLAARTRWWLFDRAVEENWLIIGSHLSDFSRVRRVGETYGISAA